MAEIARIAADHPSCFDAHMFLAKSFWAINPVKYFELARDSAEAAYALRPSDAGAKNIASAVWFGRGQAAWDAQDWPTAYAAYKRSFEIDPAGSESFGALEFASRQAECKGELATLVESLLKQNLLDDSKIYWLANYYFEFVEERTFTPDKEWAKKEMLRRGSMRAEEYLTAKPDCPHGLLLAGKIANRSGDKQKASACVARLQGVDVQKAQELQYLVDEF